MALPVTNFTSFLLGVTKRCDAMRCDAVLPKAQVQGGELLLVHAILLGALAKEADANHALGPQAWRPATVVQWEHPGVPRGSSYSKA